MNLNRFNVMVFFAYYNSISTEIRKYNYQKLWSFTTSRFTQKIYKSAFTLLKCYIKIKYMAIII